MHYPLLPASTKTVDIFLTSIFNLSVENKVPNIFFVLAVFIVLLLYIPINSFTNSTARVLSTSLDGRIPFVPLFIVAYLSFFLLLPWSLFSFLTEKEHLYRQMCCSIMIVSLVSYFMYLLYRTTIVRPTVIEFGIINRLVSFVYSVDQPYSCFPSMHSSLSTVLAVHWFRSDSRIKYFVLSWSAVIILSTLMVKQHHLLDVVGGIVLGFSASLLMMKLSDFLHNHRGVLLGIEE